jgi:transcriptional regulator with XRE-family HTH domain
MLLSMTRSLAVADTVDRRIGQTAHMLMWNARISQTDMGRLIGMNQSYLSRKLRGEVRWYATEIEAVAKVLGVSAGVLFGELPPEGQPTNPTDGGASNEKVWSSILQRGSTGSRSVITHLPSGDRRAA